jgi:hypothetical protein
MAKLLLSYLYVFSSCELVSLVVFPVFRRLIVGRPIFKKPDIETFKGVLERLVIFVGLTSGHSTVLVMFGALKLGTRLHDEGEKNVSNNYFLIGNFLSALIAIAGAIISKRLIP